jgi:hypothetical protein
MKPLCAILAFLILLPASGLAQTREETVDFIIGEYKAFESDPYRYREITFSPSGDAFTLYRVAHGKKAYEVTFKLKDVEIYKVTINHANGINKHQLMAHLRGWAPRMTKNGAPLKGPLKITPAIENENKCLALERAFARLTTLTTGRKVLFSN